MAGPIIRSRVIICLLFLLTIGPLTPSTTAQTLVSLPTLTSAIAATIPSEAIVVTGRGFSPSRLVFVALYDRWGSNLLENRWVVASQGFYGTDGSADPARGFAQGGNITEQFLVTADATYGPNGSQDPAVGYQPGLASGSYDLIATACRDNVMVRAYDRDAAVWTNLLDVASNCGA